MRYLLLLPAIFFGSFVFAQTVFGPKYDQTLMAKLNTSDSLVYYQCRAKTGALTIKSGEQTIETKEQKLSITEKFVIIKQNNEYVIRYWISGLTVFPNRKFSGLKIREKDYWNFTFKQERKLSDNELLFFAGLEKSSKETTEYDFAITKYTTNQLIIKHRKDFEQLLPKENLSISEALKL